MSALTSWSNCRALILRVVLSDADFSLARKSFAAALYLKKASPRSPYFSMSSSSRSPATMSFKNFSAVFASKILFLSSRSSYLLSEMLPIVLFLTKRKGKTPSWLTPALCALKSVILAEALVARMNLLDRPEFISEQGTLTVLSSVLSTVCQASTETRMPLPLPNLETPGLGSRCRCLL